MERADLRKWVQLTGVGVERGEFVFLRDPHWSRSELNALEAQVVVADTMKAESGWLCIPTGGTSGQIRFARHDERTLGAAVSGFCLHFGIQRVNAVSVLPLHHVSGLMARLRCATTAGDYLPWDWKQMAAGDYPSLRKDAGEWFLSLVPTQLQRLLERADGADFLRRFRVVFLGGGPTWPELADAAAKARVPVALSYGMTETAAMIAAQMPEDFVRGARDAGRPLPHVRIEIMDAHPTEDDETVPIGRIRVSGDSVFRGYFPETRGEGVFETEDLGRLTATGTLEVLGRRDSGIITGGKKVWPAEVEAALLATGLFEDVAVLGIPDATWGERVVACFSKGRGTVSVEAVKKALGDSLAGFKHPKQYLPIAPWPRNTQGKLNRGALFELIKDRNVSCG